MARQMTQQTSNEDNNSYQHRTAKVVELIGTSRTSFEKAIENCINDAAESTRGITGAHVENFSVKCENGKITEYKVNLKVAFGVERTQRP
jgi:flavin-binding protein dodecin